MLIVLIPCFCVPQFSRAGSHPLCRAGKCRVQAIQQRGPVSRKRCNAALFLSMMLPLWSDHTACDSIAYFYSSSAPSCLFVLFQVEAVGELIKEGKIRHWALSNETPYGVMSHVSAADAAGVPRPAVLQQSYSLIHRQAEGSLAELCSPAALGLGILPWSALAGGVLTGAYPAVPDGCSITACLF